MNLAGSDIFRGLLGEAAGGQSPSPASPGDAPVAPRHVYRQRIYHLIPYGHFDEVLSLCEQLNDLARSRGGSGGTLWMLTVGEQNQLIVEFEFPDLATFEAGRAARSNDPEWNAVVQKISAGVIPGSVRTELVETAMHLSS